MCETQVALPGNGNDCTGDVAPASSYGRGWPGEGSSGGVGDSMACGGGYSLG